ncbi:MAG: hypothetical protein J6M43_08530 [Neisseriaceae bacterium]|nr:hypothetical protein [Neisseriaceae bacterium]
MNEVHKKMTKSSSRSLGEAKTRFVSPLGEIFIDEVNKGLRSHQAEVSANEVKLKRYCVIN